MGDFYAGITVLEKFFLLCALVGGFFVLVRLAMQFLGAVHDVSDISVDTDFNGDVGEHHTDSDVGFKLLSMHGMTSFLMMFGLVGLAMYRQSEVGIFFSIAGATLAGLFSVWVIGRIFKLFSSLQSSGTLVTQNAVGSSGTVYMTIPSGGVGRVTINFNNHLREFDAESADGSELATGTTIKVVRVKSNMLMVERIV